MLILLQGYTFHGAKLNTPMNMQPIRVDSLLSLTGLVLEYATEHPEAVRLVVDIALDKLEMG